MEINLLIGANVIGEIFNLENRAGNIIIIIIVFLMVHYNDFWTDSIPFLRKVRRHSSMDFLTNF